MGSDTGRADSGSILPEHLPHDLLAQTFTSDYASAVQGPKYVPRGNIRGSRPGVDRRFDPRRYRFRSDAPVLAPEIDNAPAAITLLEMAKRERRHFGATQPTA